MDPVGQITSVVLIRNGQTDWFKISLLGVAKTAITRLVAKFWLGHWFSKSNSILACCFLLFFLLSSSIPV